MSRELTAEEIKRLHKLEGIADKLYDADWYIDMYTRRNEEIKRYFMKAPKKLLVIDVTQEKTTEKICRFLNIPTKYIINMPHSNET